MSGALEYTHHSATSMKPLYGLTPTEPSRVAYFLFSMSVMMFCCGQEVRLLQRLHVRIQKRALIQNASAAAGPWRYYGAETKRLRLELVNPREQLGCRVILKVRTNLRRRQFFVLERCRSNLAICAHANYAPAPPISTSFTEVSNDLGTRSPS